MPNPPGFARISSALLGALCLAATAPAGVLVVDPSGSGDFTALQSAVDGAADGDTLLVHSGVYSTCVVSNKALSIVAAIGADVQVVGGVRVRTLAAGKTVVLARLKAVGSITADPLTAYGLHLIHNAGHLRVEQCQLTGAGGSASLATRDGFDGVRVDSCADVALVGTTCKGGSGLNGGSRGAFPGTSGAGMRAIASSVTLYDDTLLGGVGMDGTFASGNWNGGHGGAAYSGAGSTLFVSGSTCTGGDGGDGQTTNCFTSEGGNGGAGIALTSGGDQAHVLATPAAGGWGGAGILVFCAPVAGPQAPARSGAPAQFVDLTGSAHRLSAPVPVHEAAPATLTFTGQPGDHVALLLSRTVGATFVPAQSGVVLVAPPYRTLQLGTVPASGALTVQLPMPDLGAGIDAIRLFAQSSFTDAGGSSVLGSPATLVVLDRAF